MAEKMLARKEVPVEITWDLNRIFKTQADFYAARDELSKLVNDYQKKYEGKLESTQDSSFVLKAIEEYEQVTVKLRLVASYASLGLSTDQLNPDLQKISQDTSSLLDQMGSKLSFFSSEISEIDPQVLEKAIEETEKYKVFLQDALAWKPHQLSKETESVLAALGSTLEYPFTAYNVAKFQDMKFPNFEANGKTYPLSYVLYENEYCEHPDTEIRRESFRVFSETLAKYRNTTAQAYNAQVQKEKTISKLRGFDSVFDYLLFPQKVDKALYDRQIDLIMSELAPHMRRYAALLKKVYGLDEMRYSDLKLVLDPDFSPEVSIEDSKEYISDAMKPMGQEYHDLVMRSYDERWVDFAQNEGKRTGGFCSTVAEAGPFILLSWNDKLSEVFTLAHELGHAAQGLVTQANNSLLEARFTRYDVEAPSTFHEMLLTKSLLAKSDSPRFERWVLSSMVGNTYYHNCVTHLLEAAYQREVYKLVDQGQSLTADLLDKLYKEVLVEFWGEDIVMDHGAEQTWMRQPHYYMGLYSYVYSASLTISTAMFHKVQAEGDELLEKWIEYLKVGGPMPPAEKAEILGIDITTDEPLRNTIAFIGEMITQMEELTDQLS